MRIRCNLCRGTFPWAAGSWPKACPHCGVGMDLPEGDEPTAPAIKHGRTAATDQVYRDMERGSETRAEIAADRLGVPVSDMSGLKITDLSDRPVRNEVTQFMDAHPGVVGLRPDGVQFSGAVQTGPFPNAGIRALQGVRGAHANTTRQVMRGFDAATRTPWVGEAAVSDLPALETLQPGYRRRT